MHVVPFAIVAHDALRIVLLWDSIVEEDPDLAIPLSPALMQELDQRLTEHKADPTAVIPWDQVRDELVTTLRRRRR
jgi:putative addiction module component (TIGR02574 family)